MPRGGFIHSPVKFENKPNDQCLPFTLDLPTSHVKFIDKHEELVTEGFKRAVESCVLCGIDTETKPQFFPTRNSGKSRGKGKVSGRDRQQDPNPTALIQIAIRCSDSNEYVFLLDLIALIRPEKRFDELDALLEKLFSDSSVVKIGQGLSQDLREMRDSYPDMRAFRKMMNIVDTNAIHKLIQPDVVQQVSLKNFTRIYLNFNLVKRQQLSNWAKRPLTEAQVKYAACDALVLLRLFDAMSCEVEDLYSKPVDIESLKVDIELPVYVHIPDYIKQEDREVKARARVAGLLPAGTINNANAAQDECNSNSLSIEDINAISEGIEGEIISDAIFDYSTCTSTSTSTSGSGGGGGKSVNSKNSKRERSVSIGEFKRLTATKTKSISQREIIWIPHHRKLTEM